MYMMTKSKKNTELQLVALTMRTSHMSRYVVMCVSKYIHVYRRLANINIIHAQEGDRNGMEYGICRALPRHLCIPTLATCHVH